MTKDRKDQAVKFWNVPVYGYDDIVALAATSGKARWRVFLLGKDAGHFNGRDGFSRFLTDVGRIREISAQEARRQIGGHSPVGAPKGWDWPEGLSA